jgi:hypothetical protein
MNLAWSYFFLVMNIVQFIFSVYISVRAKRMEAETLSNLLRLIIIPYV